MDFHTKVILETEFSASSDEIYPEHSRLSDIGEAVDKVLTCTWEYNVPDN